MPLDLTDLPDEVRELIEPHAAETPETLDAIGVMIAQKRDEAKSARASSGIETVWTDCESAYVGIDEANRGEFTDAKWSKPMSMDGPVTTGKVPKTDYKSTAFVRLTARYVDQGAAKVSDILLPPNGKAFSFSETPIPDLIKAKDDKSQVVHDGLGNAPLMRDAKPGEVPPPALGASPMPSPQMPGAGPPLPAPASAAAPVPGAVPAAGAAGGQPQAAPQVPLTVADLANENIEIAHDKAKAAETRIYDQMVECQYTAEMRKLIFDSARIGVGVLKAPFPKVSKSVALSKDRKKTGIVIEMVEKIAPAAKWVDPWNIFPDPACGENIHDGDYIFERDYLSERQLRDLKKSPGYIGTQIDKIIEEGPDKTKLDGSNGGPKPAAAARKGRYEIWYFYGTLKRSEMNSIDEAAGKPPKDKTKPTETVYVIVTLINDSVIKATFNPLDSGSFCYHSIPWQRRAGHWAGIGVAEQLRMPQRMVNAATRAMLNNAGISAGAQIIIDMSSVKPAGPNNDWTITPNKIWLKTGDSPGDDVRKSFAAVEFPNVTDELMKIIEYGMRLAEESTSIPLITQGQTGPTQPDTLGATQIQNNNANQLLRDIGYRIDDHITEPVVRQWYEWNLLDPEIPDEEKGDFKINAHGSIALVEQAIQDQTIAQMAGLVLNPAYKINPAKWAKMYLQSKRIDPIEVLYTAEEQAKMDAAPPPQAPAVQVAQIAADTAMKELVAKQQGDQQTAQNETQIAQAAQALEGKKVDVKHQEIATDATIRLHELQERRELALLDYANQNKITIDRAKADLAKTTMTLSVQKELNAADHAVDLHKHHNPQAPKLAKPRTQVARPAAEPPGRAPAGQAFEQ